MNNSKDGLLNLINGYKRERRTMKHHMVALYGMLHHVEIIAT